VSHTFADVLGMKITIKPNDQLDWFSRYYTSFFFAQREARV